LKREEKSDTRLGLYFYPEDGSGIFLLSVCWLSTVYMA
jgi:hypothetical protein